MIEFGNVVTSDGKGVKWRVNSVDGVDDRLHPPTLSSHFAANWTKLTPFSSDDVKVFDWSQRPICLGKSGQCGNCRTDSSVFVLIERNVATCNESVGCNFISPTSSLWHLVVAVAVDSLNSGRFNRQVGDNSKWSECVMQLILTNVNELVDCSERSVVAPFRLLHRKRTSVAALQHSAKVRAI